jgi:hypothetical protein
MMKTILVTLVLFHLVDLKLSKCLIQSEWYVKPIGLDFGRRTSGKGSAPFAGLRVILNLRAGTDSGQPIRVVRDSYVKG